MINRGFRYKLAPTDAQAEMFVQFAGVCRLIYNIALEQRRDWYRQYEANTSQKLNYIAQARELTALRAEFEWIAAVTQTCQQQALRDLDKAYSSFFKGISGYPTPRKRGVNDSFRFQGREVEVKPLNAKWALVRLPKIGWVKFRTTRAVIGTIKNVTISLASDGWHISFACAIEHTAPANNNPAIGIDRGIVNALALSNGEMIAAPSSFKKLDQQKRKAQRVLARRKRGSRNYAKQRKRVAALAAKAARIRKHFLHCASSGIAQRYGVVVLEALKVKNMTASAKGTVEEHGKNVRQKAGLNRAILEQGWAMFATLLDYKLAERGGYLATVNPAYTSQTCSACGTIDKQSRKNQATFICQDCGFNAHADTNAAINILRRWNTPLLPVEALVRGLAKQELTAAKPSKISNLLGGEDVNWKVSEGTPAFWVGKMLRLVHHSI